MTAALFFLSSFGLSLNPIKIENLALENAPLVASLVMHAFYGPHKPLHGLVAWAQRRVIQANILDDLRERQAYYRSAKQNHSPHVGALLVASTQDGKVCGFLDIGMPAYCEEENTYDLPRLGASFPAAPLKLRAYLSNLAVEPSARRSGVGTLLLNACETLVLDWDPCPEAIWLECSESNTVGLRFYESIGFERVGTAAGREIVRGPFSYDMTEVDRIVMRKPLLLAPEQPVQDASEEKR